MPHPEQPSYEELAARNAELLAMVAEQAALIGALRAEVAALRRQAGRDSSNSSQPPSRDSPAAKAEKKGGQREGRRARPGRPQGRQPATGPPGSYPDRTSTGRRRRAYEHEDPPWHYVTVLPPVLLGARTAEVKTKA